MATELWLPSPAKSFLKGIQNLVFYLLFEMFGTMRIYEFTKIQSRSHKLEVYSHGVFFFFFFTIVLKKKISFQRLWQGDIYSQHFHQPFLHGTPNNIYSNYKMCTCCENTALRQSPGPLLMVVQVGNIIV